MNITTIAGRVLVAALATAAGNAVADDDEVHRLITPESTVSVGAGSWSGDRPQFGIYDGMAEGKAYGLLDFDVRRRDDATGTWKIFTGRNIGTDAREVSGEYLVQGSSGFSVRYNEIPRDNPLTFITGMRGIGSTTLIVSGTGANALAPDDVRLGTERKQVDLGFYKNFLPGLDLNVNFRDERKKGTRLWGRGGQPEFAVEPIDATTRQLEVTLGHVAERWQLSGGYYGSWYDNHNTLVDSYYNGADTTVLANHIYLSLPLSNQAHQLFLNGGYNFTGVTRATFKFEYGRATQDEQLPTAGIAGLAYAGAPESVDGELVTTTAQLGLSSRPAPDLSLVAGLRYHHLDEKTPQARFVYITPSGTNVCGDTASTTCVDNTPLSFKTITGKIEATYRLPDDFSVIGGVERREQDRTVPVGTGSVTSAGVDTQRYVPFRAELDETTWRLQLRRALAESVNGSLAYLDSRRRGSELTRTNETESDEINPIHVADRDRQKWRLTFDWTPSDRLALQVNIEDARDDYLLDDVRPYGMKDGTARIYSLDATYTVTRNWQVTAWLSHDQTRATEVGQRAANGGAAPAEKDAELRDTGDAVGLGVRGRPTGSVRVGADWQWLRTVEKYDQSVALLGAGTLYPVSGTVTAQALPDIKNYVSRTKLFAEYALDANSEVRLDLIHERWKTDDWSWQFADGTAFTYGATNDGTVVSTRPRQTSTYGGVRYLLRF